MADVNITNTLNKHRVIPVIAIESEEHALPLADALIEGGLPIAEVTFRTEAAADVIHLLVDKRPELLVGAGTVLNIANLEAAKSCGAQFGVAPGTNPDVVQKAADLAMPFFPGVATPSDIEHALALGCQLLKLFPSEALGGLGFLKSIAAPYLHTGVRFIPTGGVNAGNLAEYLRSPVVTAVGGTWIAKKDDLNEGRWEDIRSRCKEVAEIAARVAGS